MTIYANLATVFGIGRVRYAPGTAGSAAAMLIAVPVLSFAGWAVMGILALAITALAIWAADGYGVETDRHDPQDCVIDEVAGQWVACAIAGMAAMPGKPVLSIAGYVLAFLLFRLFDIAKPWPIKQAESLRGGLGIVADDVLAGIVAGVVVFLLAYWNFV
jgi:phosphatidylglycerophosphatase A